MGVLTNDQVARFETEGYLLASGLIPEAVSERAETAMWELLGMDPDRPETWTRIPEDAIYVPDRGLIQHFGIQNPDLLACATPAFLSATAQLIGTTPEALHPPEAIHTQNVFPLAREWAFPTPHVDGIPKENRLRTFPGPYRVAILVYLSTVQPHGGGTAIWPGSHRKIRALAEANREAYPYLYELNPRIKELDLGDPVELLPKRGDVLFFQHLFGHNGTPNVGSRPRFMMRYFCSCNACRRWKKTEEWNFWTP